MHSANRTSLEPNGVARSDTVTQHAVDNPHLQHPQCFLPMFKLPAAQKISPREASKSTTFYSHSFQHCFSTPSRSSQQLSKPHVPILLHNTLLIAGWFTGLFLSASAVANTLQGGPTRPALNKTTLPNRSK